MALSNILSENTDEILAICTVIPIVLALIYLSVVEKVDPAVVLLPPMTLVLGFYFGRKSAGGTNE